MEIQLNILSTKKKKKTKQEGGFSKENPSGYQKLNFLLPILWIVYECMHLIFFYVRYY